MQFSERQRHLMIAAIAAVLLLAGYELALSPFLDFRAGLIEQRDAANRDLAEAHHILQVQEELRPLSRSMASSLNADPSTVESRLLHFLHDWQQHAGVANASFQRLHGMDAHGFTCLTFSVSATGGMGAVASLLYEIETSPMPLRIDGARVTPRHDGTDDLQVRLNISTLCRAVAPGTSPGAAVAKIDATGVPQ